MTVVFVVVLPEKSMRYCSTTDRQGMSTDEILEQQQTEWDQLQEEEERRRNSFDQLIRNGKLFVDEIAHRGQYYVNAEKVIDIREGVDGGETTEMGSERKVVEGMEYGTTNSREYAIPNGTMVSREYSIPSGIKENQECSIPSGIMVNQGYTIPSLQTVTPDYLISSESMTPPLSNVQPLPERRCPSLDVPRLSNWPPPRPSFEIPSCRMKPETHRQLDKNDNKGFQSTIDVYLQSYPNLSQSPPIYHNFVPIDPITGVETIRYVSLS